jgi:hypothetical protein
MVFLVAPAKGRDFLPKLLFSLNHIHPTKPFLLFPNRNNS